MDKNIGFNRNIRLVWLDATAALCGASDDPGEIRRRLNPIVGEEIASAVNRRKTIDILINIWVKTGDVAPPLRSEAVARFASGSVAADRHWLHYGLTLLYYPFVREAAAAIGQLARFGDPITPGLVKQRLVASRGQLGSLEKAVERVIFSLRDWGLLVGSEQRNAYQPGEPALSADDVGLESWLLACILHAHPAHELPFADLVRLPELFPFRFSLGTDHLRRSTRFSVQRQGVAWDMVGLASTASNEIPARPALAN